MGPINASADRNHAARTETCRETECHTATGGQRISSPRMMRERKRLKTSKPPVESYARTCRSIRFSTGRGNSAVHQGRQACTRRFFDRRFCGAANLPLSWGAGGEVAPDLCRGAAGRWWLSCIHGRLASFAPHALFKLLFASARGSDAGLAGDVEFQTTLGAILRTCFVGNLRGYVKDIDAYV